MSKPVPESLGLIAGKGAYPLLLAESARQQGVKRIFAVAFKGETERSVSKFTDETVWLNVGQLARLLEALKNSGVRHAVMAGQITPTNLFRVRMDRMTLDLLRKLPVRNAQTIFAAVADELKRLGIDLMPASSFMEAHMPRPGVLTGRKPTEEEQRDIQLGLKVALAVSALEIGQTVVVKQGTILAVEAFEGTDAAIERGGKLAQGGIVVVKLAKRGHDMRFDIPVVGTHTMKILAKAKAAALAIEAGRSILLERERVIEAADRMGLAIVAVEPSS